MGETWVKDAGTWYDVTQESYGRAGGTWWLGVEVWVKDAGSWNLIWQFAPAQVGTPSASNITPYSVSLSWGAVSGAAEYDVLRDGSVVATVTGTSWNDSSLSWNSTYKYRVRARNSFGIDGPQSGERSVTTGRVGLNVTLSSSNRKHDRVTVTRPNYGNGASSVEWWRGSTRVAVNSNSSYTFTGLAKSTNYDIKVRPVQNTGRVGDWSRTYRYFTGRPEERDSGTSGWIDTFTVATGSWRTASNNVWGQRGDKILQGVYSGYQQYGYYRGLIDYGHQGVYNKVHSALGGGSRATNRINNGSVVNGTAEVFLWKNCGVGTNGAITLRWYRTNTAAGSNPSPIGSAYDVGTTACGDGNWLDIGNTHGTNIVKSKNRGLCVIYDSTSSSRYGEFNGRSAGHWDCVLHLKWTWNYVSVSYQAPTWTQR